MPSSNKRSRTFRRVFTRLPGGRSKLNYRRRKPGKIHCYNCGQELHGTASKIVTRLKNMPLTHKRPERQYAGVLCSFCSREKLKETIRK